ncbi:MAG: hypothetical protein A3I07_01330 [Candidatus Doudnabacteria bacterium RIFCSPLOWO2_02_FULL_42_9]|uniref:Type II secretion system protein GspG C-terminal domain-containing protein n=1 Tax=Candidatus Doudnabacteria bacterium RIFCSPHIGHO2_01_FULL_41_86 TaxID=1817821 RepID=A0A1F5N912_9BACT|nr:MAG: hypothetical protein A2717_00890 [Candidatus Doudnabacteria bacterium RIFCSPHIGHO2_01_FULL_41_86]OGE75399.1 MAG: hypothetical protein A3K07_01405 [Candidatus Doudnabacteria bacterium RIFCSPHIGHO2_01_43_10]OGE86575.1 MAG: hypothetical protein A3E28_04165 [Candidatus Doudnabacteria bacterium RIFCSPHIGHO2_12_FULL_42_22]OGE87475.1 MAG: hypothetical protein A3C49_03825 [Candidatus Doudnabacteria bacterium RIFCSPHIGHO2_02_FULL_42_25]OGE92790.1 MAG: hypothetical protein A2895_04690 [Candidatus
MVQNLNIYKLIVLGLIVVLSASTIVLAFVNAKSEATTRQRIADVEKIEEALKIYFEVNGFYPQTDNGQPKDIELYLEFYPSYSNCSYTYERLAGGNDYKLNRCQS